jgi:uncharacterized NAD(P)/FAD-binding protein YdhS
VTRPIEVVVVGGGASGLLVAARILDATHAQPARVAIVERAGPVGAGVAYGTDDPDHSLNVRVGMMSADPSRPGEFAEWASTRGVSDPTAFVPRRGYRTYLADHLETAVAGAADGVLEVVTDRAIAMSAGSAPSVVLASGRALRADAVVVATGNPAPGIPGPARALVGHPAWIGDPWAEGALERLGDARSVLMIGTGLTAVDVILTAARIGKASLTAVSRHGLLPAAHIADVPLREVDVAALFAGADTLRELTRRVCARARAPGEDRSWRDVVDNVRPVANALWSRLDDDDRQRFIAHLARYWDVHRHRMPPRSAEVLEALRSSGRLATRAAHIVGIEVGDGDGLTVDVDLLVDGRLARVTADAVVNCTGPAPAWRHDANPFVTDLIERGLAVPDRTGLGLAASPVGQLVDPEGQPTANAFVIGPPRRGSLWESTAVPEIRSQALHIADRIMIGEVTP